MRFKQVAKGIMGVMLAVALTGCASGNSKQEDAAKEKLVVQFVPTNNDGTMEAKAKPFAEYLSKEARSSGGCDLGYGLLNDR